LKDTGIFDALKGPSLIKIECTRFSTISLLKIPLYSSQLK